MLTKSLSLQSLSYSFYLNSLNVNDSAIQRSLSRGFAYLVSPQIFLIPHLALRSFSSFSTSECAIKSQIEFLRDSLISRFFWPDWMSSVWISFEKLYWSMICSFYSLWMIPSIDHDPRGGRVREVNPNIGYWSFWFYF